VPSRSLVPSPKPPLQELELSARATGKLFQVNRNND
jgi:hypothetical protein